MATAVTPASIAPRGVYELPGTLAQGGVLLYSVDSSGHVEGPFHAADDAAYRAIQEALIELLDANDPPRPALRLVKVAPQFPRQPYSPALTALLCRPKATRRA